MSVALLILAICISYLIVRIGAIALEMTGMERSRARFQALYAFSGTGFTTREAELVVNHPRRRKIVTYLMILGNAGIVSVVATLVISLKPSGLLKPTLNLSIIIGALLVLYRMVTHRKFAVKLSEKISHILRDRFYFEKVQFQEVLQQSQGYGVAQVLVGKDSNVAGKLLKDSGFREADLLVISDERDEKMIPIPRAETKIRPGDRLTCYGKLENLSKLLEAPLKRE